MTTTATKKANGGEPAEERVVPPLRPADCYFEAAGQKTQALLIFADEKMRAEDVARPEIWQLLVDSLVPLSTAWVHAADESWAVEVMIRSNIPGRCSVHVLRTARFDPIDHSAKRVLPENYAVVYLGAADGWGAVRTNPDGSKQTLVTTRTNPSLQTEEETVRWLLDQNFLRQAAVGPRRIPR